MTQYNIQEQEDNITITLPTNTTYTPTTYNNTTYHNNNTQHCITAEKNGKTNCFSLITLHQVQIPKTTLYNNTHPIILLFTDIQEHKHYIELPYAVSQFEEQIAQQLLPAFVNNTGYMYGFIKTVLFHIYTNTEINKILTQQHKK